MEGERDNLKHTVQRNGNALAQHVAIGAHKDGDLAEGVDLEQLLVVLGVLVFVCVDNVQLDAVGFGDGEDGCCSGVGLDAVADTPC